ncbi:MAG: phosphatidate cytidylyltransferase [Proteobacteria bacterium]|nr:phosphatidate cytidylyltransferase [Pseudomonadota bacterium]
MLKQRVITSIVALAAFMVVLFEVPAVVAQVVIAILIIGGAWEWSRFLGASGLASRIIYVALLAALMGLAAWQLAASSMFIFQLALVWWLAALVWVFFFPTPIPLALRWLCGALVLVPLFVALIALYRNDPALLLFALLIVWAADTGAYFAGRQFGRVKLAPRISPNKTWEGVIGGLLVVVLMSFAGAAWVDIELAVLIPFCLAVACMSIVGDLTVSMFKRNAGLKDSGTLFPGHGGVLDRIDSVAAAAPLFALGVSWMGLQ